MLWRTWNRLVPKSCQKNVSSPDNDMVGLFEGLWLMGAHCRRLAPVLGPWQRKKMAIFYAFPLFMSASMVRHSWRAQFGAFCLNQPQSNWQWLALGNCLGHSIMDGTVVLRPLESIRSFQSTANALYHAHANGHQSGDEILRSVRSIRRYRSRLGRGHFCAATYSSNKNIWAALWAMGNAKKSNPIDLTTEAIHCCAEYT